MNGFERLLRIVEDSPLSRSLPVVLSAANSIEDDNLASWVKLELMGYHADNQAMTSDTVVPEYRAVAGNWYDDYGRLFLLTDRKLLFVNQFRMRHGVAELEGLSTATGPLSVRDVELSNIIRESLHVDISVFQFQAASVAQVLTNIKVQLMDRLADRRKALAKTSVPDPKPEGELLQLKPGFKGVSIDLKVLWRRLFGPKPEA